MVGRTGLPHALLWRLFSLRFVIELRSHPEVCYSREDDFIKNEMVGRTGFEPATSGTQNQRSTKLSYPPPWERKSIHRSSRRCKRRLRIFYMMRGRLTNTVISSCLPTMATAVSIYDTTLRDGTQGEGFFLSGFDKLRLAKRR